MTGFVITTNVKSAQQLVEQLTDKPAQEDRRVRIIHDFSERYQIVDEVFHHGKVHANIDYLPTFDAMIDTKRTVPHAKRVVGAALYKIELDHALFFTDSRDQNLRRVYEQRCTLADLLAERLWHINNEEYPLSWTHVTASVLSGSFQLTFGQFYGDWRKSLAKRK